MEKKKSKYFVLYFHFQIFTCTWSEPNSTLNLLGPHSFPKDVLFSREWWSRPPPTTTTHTITDQPPICSRKFVKWPRGWWMTHGSRPKGRWGSWMEHHHAPPHMAVSVVVVRLNLVNVGQLWEMPPGSLRNCLWQSVVVTLLLCSSLQLAKSLALLGMPMCEWRWRKVHIGSTYLYITYMCLII